MNAGRDAIHQKVVVPPDPAYRFIALVPGSLCLTAYVLIFGSARPSGSGQAGPTSSLIIAVLIITVVAALTVWGATQARISVTRSADAHILLSAPMYHRRIEIARVSDIRVSELSVMNTGWLNWPVSGRAASDRGLRLNVGGCAQVAFTVDGKFRMTIVARDALQAKNIAKLLQT
ncbi:hypothetical protein [Glutamicibacter sp.]|uniref:hypothetical protein n=1 Tax=Glutamicibacter sp. TaxID=1931995 RepID=UPI0028BDE8FE|nr:hypothetical protein [Glutamicibacter sp.]